MFRKLGLSEALCEALNALKISKPTDIQSKAIAEGLKGKNMICSAQTGTGKTLAYLLPLFEKLKRDELSNKAIRKSQRPRAMVVVPSRELGVQVAGVAKHLSHYSKCITGLVTGGASKRKQKEVLQKPIDLLIATPGRLSVFLEDNQVYMSNLKYLVIDEADTLYDSSAGFKQDLEKVLTPAKAGAERRHKDLQYTFAAATLKPPMDQILLKQAPNCHLLVSDKVHQRPEKVKEHFIRVKGHGDKHMALRQVLESSSFERMIIFCNTTKSCQSTEHMLREHGYQSVSLHGDMAPIARQKGFEQFVSGEATILVCTDLAARGLDIRTVDHVVLFDFPRNAVDYLHRIGRTGRANESGTATSLITRYDTTLVEELRSGRKTTFKPKMQVKKRPNFRPKAVDRNQTRRRRG